MSGHSKWNNIKRRKGAVDEKRAKIFSKLGREIQIAVREGGPDPDKNSLLRDVVAKAKSYNMPSDNIQRSISRASGDSSSSMIEEILYEGYGPGGVAVMVRALTDNRNRTAGEVRHIFDKYGGNLGTDGCVAFQFERKGTLIIESEDAIDEEQLFIDALEAGAEDVDMVDADDDEYIYQITTSPNDYAAVRDKLAQKYEFADQDLGPVPISWVMLEDEESISNMAKLIDLLEDNDNVQDVYHNWDQEDDE
ncbi:MAG TPA: YebC/PmpR family DNA-binding transcriptional regulator [Bacillota bacterium]|nr:YebC/PmpR family DNA-binding transcriptional regulator [Bacillota bacterium]